MSDMREIRDDAAAEINNAITAAFDEGAKFARAEATKAERERCAGIVRQILKGEVGYVPDLRRQIIDRIEHPEKETP